MSSVTELQRAPYLQLLLGKILPRALSEICEKRPPDPIEELARWLYQWADCELYYYEKAIFAKELQLMALQLEKENARRLARMAALTKEMHALKYLLGGEHMFASHLQKDKTSQFGSDMDIQELARKHINDDASLKSGEFSPGAHIMYTNRRQSKDVLMRRRLRGEVDEGDLSSDARSDKKRRRKYGTQDEEDLEQSKRKGKKRWTEFDTDEDGKLRGRRKSKKILQFDEGDDDDDSFGPDAKLKYGFAVTPTRCSWYLAEPRILVCVHPVLGELRATIPSIIPVSDVPEWWDHHQFDSHVHYDPEIYTLEDPYFDDAKYKNRIAFWVDGELLYIAHEEEGEEDQLSEVYQ